MNEAEVNNEQATVTPPPAADEGRLTLRRLVEYELAVMSKLYESEGELTPEVMELLRLTADALPEKVDGYAHMLDRLASEKLRLEVIVTQYTQMIDALDGAVFWMKESLKNSMLTLERDELAGIDRKFRLMRASPRLEVIHEHLPAAYMKESVVYSRDTDLIKKDLAAGVKVPGAKMVESYYVRSFANNPAKAGERPKKVKAAKKSEVTQ